MGSQDVARCVLSAVRMQLYPKVCTWLCGLFAALGSVTFGYDHGIIATIFPSEDFNRVKGNPDATSQGLIVGYLLLGVFASNIYVGSLADWAGRRVSILIGCVVFLLEGGIQTGAQNIHYMYGGRFLVGMGIAYVAVFFFLHLLSSRLASMVDKIHDCIYEVTQFMLEIGALVASFIGYGCFHGLTGQAQWHLPSGIQMSPALPPALFILLLPESPGYLVMRGRDKEVLLVLARLYAHGDVTDTFVVAEHKEILDQIALEREQTQDGWTQLFTGKSDFRRLVLGVALQFSVRMTGVSVIQYYLPQIFASIGIDTSATLGLQSGNSDIALIGEALCVCFIDRLGRRGPLVWSNIISGFTFVIGTIIIKVFSAGSGHGNASRAFVAMTWLFNLVFSCGIGPLSWAILEMFNSATRAKATTLTSAAAWISNFMIAQVTPLAFANAGWRFYLVFAICGFSSALFFWAFLPETRGIPLEDLDTCFENVPTFVPHSRVITGGVAMREEDLQLGHVCKSVGVHDNTAMEEGDIQHLDEA